MPIPPARMAITDVLVMLTDRVAFPTDAEVIECVMTWPNACPSGRLQFLQDTTKEALTKNLTEGSGLFSVATRRVHAVHHRAFALWCERLGVTAETTRRFRFGDRVRLRPHGRSGVHEQLPYPGVIVGIAIDGDLVPGSPGALRSDAGWVEASKGTRPTYLRALDSGGLVWDYEDSLILA